MKAQSLVLVALLVSVNAALAQDQKPGDTQQGYILWIYPHGDAKAYTIGAYLTYNEAREAEKKWVAEHPNSLDLPSIKEGPVTVSRKAVKGVSKSGQEEPSSSSGRGGTIVQPSPGNKAANKKKWEMWLDEVQRGQWKEVPNRRKEFDDYDEFRKAFEDYKSKIEPFNRNGVRYQVNWKEVDLNLITKPDLPFVDVPADKTSLAYVLPRVSGTYNNHSNKGKMIINPSGRFVIYSWTGRVDDTGKVTGFDADSKKLIVRFDKGFDMHYQVSDDLADITEFPYKRAGR